MKRAFIMRAVIHDFELTESGYKYLEDPKVVFTYEIVEKTAKRHPAVWPLSSWKEAGLPEPEDFVGHLIETPLDLPRLVAYWRGEVNQRQRPVLAIDFDGVIAEFHGWTGDKNFGESLPGVSSALRRLKEKGWWICIYTTREPVGVQHYCTTRGIPVDSIGIVPFRNWTKKKPPAEVYLDDRGMQFHGEWNIELIEAIDSFHPYWEDPRKPESFVPVTNTGMAEAAEEETKRRLEFDGPRDNVYVYG